MSDYEAHRSRQGDRRPKYEVASDPVEHSRRDARPRWDETTRDHQLSQSCLLHQRPVSAPTFRCLFLQRVLSCAPTFWYSSKRRRVLVRARPHGSVPRRGWPVPSHRKTGALGHWDRVFRLFHPAPTGARAVAAVSVTNRADSRRPRPCGAVLEPERLNRRVDTGYRGEDLFFESGEPARLSLGITRSAKAIEPLKLGRLRPQTGREPTRLSHRHNERSMLRRELGWRIEGIHSLQGFLTSRTPTDGIRL